jgi:hypothetical protein
LFVTVGWIGIANSKISPLGEINNHGGPGTVKEGGAEEAKKKGLKHTFASFARPSASHPLVILSS